MMRLCLIARLWSACASAVRRSSSPQTGAASPPHDMTLVDAEGLAAALRSEPPDGMVRTNLSRRLLLAEDCPDAQRALGDELRRTGADVTIVGNGRQAVDAIMASTREPFTLVLMDMQIPAMDGYTATGLIRLRGCRIPIIAMSGNATIGDRERCMRAGCDDYIPKPVAPQDLVALCSKWLAARAAAA